MSAADVNHMESKIGAPVKIKIKVKSKTMKTAQIPPAPAPVQQNTIEVPTCSICIEPYTAKVRRCITCPYCHESICSQCLEKYLLSSIEDPHCVHCRRGWNQSLLQTFCTKTFIIKTYADYRSTILLNRSKSFLPRYQERAERIRASKRYHEQNDEYDIQLQEATKAYREALEAYEKNRYLILTKIKKNNQIANEIYEGRRDLEGNLLTPTAGAAADTASAEHRKFVRRCPAEGCNGFLSSAWKCGLCSNWTCPDCFVVKGQVKDAEHTCRNEDKETAELIRKRTKPCPNCGELIEKIDGCDQMFCTSCHSPFSWIKGEVIKTGIIHNPHYFEWLARNGGAPGGRDFRDIPCGGLPGFSGIFNRLRECLRSRDFVVSATGVATLAARNPKNVVLDTLTNAYRTCAHIIDVERNRWIAHTQPEENENTDFGVQFLLGNLKEAEWRTALKANERKRIKSKEIRDILDAFNNAAIDIWRRIAGEIADGAVNRDTVLEKMDEWMKLLKELRSFVNPPLWEISRIYNCHVPQIHEDDFTFHTNSVAKERKEAREEAAALAEAEKGLAEAAAKAGAN